MHGSLNKLTWCSISNLFSLMGKDEYVGLPTFINFQRIWKVN